MILLMRRGGSSGAAAAPVVSGIAPSSGTTAGGTSVTITGTGFVSGATVTIGGASATSVAFVSATSLTGVSPAGTAGAKDVVVTNPDTQTGALSSGFTFSAAGATGPGANEPTGMTLAFEEAWNTTPNGRTGTDWITDGSGANFSVVTDAAAPASPSNVLQVAYPTGFGWGVAPAQAYYAETAGMPANTGGVLYMRVRIKVSANWTDNGNAGTKFCFVRPHTGEGGGAGAQTNHFITLTRTGAPDFGFLTQGPSFVDSYTDGAFSKDVWHDCEWVLTLGTNGSANDGTAKLWVDGTLIQNLSGVKMLYDGQGVGNGWKYLFLDPTYGGGTNTPPADLNFQIDHWYASVK